jgi:hypothetical protein
MLPAVPHRISEPSPMHKREDKETKERVSRVKTTKRERIRELLTMSAPTAQPPITPLRHHTQE